MSEPLLDLRVLADLRKMGGPDFVNQMAEVFLESTRNVPDDLQSKVRQGDWNGVHFLAHSLKSGSGNLGLKELGAAATALEAASRRGDGETVGALAAGIPGLLARSVEALQAHLQQA